MEGVLRILPFLNYNPPWHSQTLSYWPAVLSYNKLIGNKIGKILNQSSELLILLRIQRQHSFKDSVNLTE